MHDSPMAEEKPKKNGTLEDIARRCNLSVSSVSRVLNNEPGVSAATRRRVLETAQKMRYTPRKRKRSLTRSLLNLVGQISTRAAGRDERAYLVGGAVRDLLLGSPNLDLDLVIEGDAVQLAQELAEAGQAELLAHHRFSTATLRCGDHTLDVATARRETYAHPGALPEVTPGTMRDDLTRRDFSINAMAVSSESG